MNKIQTPPESVCPKCGTGLHTPTKPENYNNARRCSRCGWKGAKA